jgi:hypothetical protein
MAYATVAEVRALEGLADTVIYPDATLQEGIDYATTVIDGYCGTSFELKAFSITLDGNGNFVIPTGVMFIKTLATITIDGIAQSVGNFYGRSDGLLVRADGDVFPHSSWGANVVVTGTAGFSTVAPPDIKWAARTLARDYVLSLKSRISGRALTVTNADGAVEVRAQPGGPGRPTALPDVNAVLNRNKHKPGMSGRVIS